MDNQISKTLYNTYLCIGREMRGNVFSADEKLKALTKELKKYVLDVTNVHNKGKRIYDPVIACQAFPFYGNSLAWNKNQWLASAAVVYNYFKAEILVREIQKYEKIFNEEIILKGKRQELLDYLYKNITLGGEMSYELAPGINANFLDVPIIVLDDKLRRFKELYEE